MLAIVVDRAVSDFLAVADAGCSARILGPVSSAGARNRRGLEATIWIIRAMDMPTLYSSMGLKYRAKSDGLLDAWSGRARESEHATTSPAGGI